MFYNNLSIVQQNKVISLPKKIMVNFIVVTIASCLLFLTMIVHAIVTSLFVANTPHNEGAEASSLILGLSVTFIGWALYVFAVFVISLIVIYVFISIAISKISRMRDNNFDQKEIHKLKIFAIASIFTIGLVFPWIIIHKIRNMQKRDVENLRI